MNIQHEKLKAQCNFTRYKGQKAGHYESYFLRANHPEKPQAFWIRYTIFSPKNYPEQALAELWGMWFDQESGEHVAIKSEAPLEGCPYSNSSFFIDFDGSVLSERIAKGSAKSLKGEISWDLTYTCNQEPIFLFPLSSYNMPLPKAKSLVSQPMALFKGSISVNGEKYKIDDWVGSQNHNWGEKHTDTYAWGQVAGFDNAPDSFLEVGSGKLKLLGPIETPYLTSLVLRHNNKEYSLNHWVDIVKAKASLGYYKWTFSSENKEVRIEGTIQAHARDFVGLTYYNPPGGNKFCLNSKIASCELLVVEKSRVGLTFSLSTRNRAAFEILTEDDGHGITMQV